MVGRLPPTDGKRVDVEVVAVLAAGGIMSGDICMLAYQSATARIK